ncbi:MAG: hypothetical protein V1907_01965 [Candidatus Kerfeldbacteria bacterium]
MSTPPRKASEHHNHHLFSLVVAFTAILAALSIYTYMYTHQSKSSDRNAEVGTDVLSGGTLPDTPTDSLTITGTVKDNANKDFFTVRMMLVVNGVATERYVRVNLTNGTLFYALGPIPTTVASVRGALPQRTKTTIARTQVAAGSSVQITIPQPLSENASPTALEVDVL